MRVRTLHPGDRFRLESLLSASVNFTAEEVGTALEVVDEALEGDPDSPSVAAWSTLAVGT